MNQQSWGRFQQRLAARLFRLIDGDTLILQYGSRYTQLQQGPSSIRVEAVSNHNLPPAEQLTAEQQERLRDMGWQPPNPPLDHNWGVDQDWPLSGRTATHLVEMMVGTLRDVYHADDLGRIEVDAFNAFAGAPQEGWLRRGAGD